MNRKIIFLVALVLGVSIESIRAGDDVPQPTLVERPVQFYAGLVGGIDRMTGRRTEQLSEAAAITTYTNNMRMLENNSTISIVGGFLWKLPPLPILMGPEVYFGRGNATSSVTATTRDALGNNRYYSTDFQRKFFYGGLIRVGYLFCPDLLGILSLGIDRSQFLTKRTLTTNSISRTKGFNGFSLGGGLEKHFGHFGFGVDFKLIQYRRQLTSDPVVLNAVKRDLTFSVRPIVYSAALRFCYLF
ncbi:MAG: hypothetical protein ACOH2E_08710 [Candidatus Paracaedibacter sp.]